MTESQVERDAEVARRLIDVLRAHGVVVDSTATLHSKPLSGPVYPSPAVEPFDHKKRPPLTGTTRAEWEASRKSEPHRDSKEEPSAPAVEPFDHKNRPPLAQTPHSEKGKAPKPKPYHESIEEPSTLFVQLGQTALGIGHAFQATARTKSLEKLQAKIRDVYPQFNVKHDPYANRLYVVSIAPRGARILSIAHEHLR